MVLTLMQLTPWLVLASCLGTSPPKRLSVETPIALLVHLESASGEARPVPALVVRELAEALTARNFAVADAPVAALGDRRASDQRVQALLAATDAPWVLLVEARARFFSQLAGRYRWEVEVRSSLVARDQSAGAQASDLAVAAFLLFEHEAEAEALAFVRRQISDDVGALIDRVMH
jgi:hypothetical protein